MGQRGPISPLKLATNKTSSAQVADPSLPDPPEWLSARALAAWNDLGPLLVREGLMHPAYRAAFACLCSSFATFADMQDELHEAGHCYETARGLTRAHPLVKMTRDYAQLFLTFAKDFGLTPASRARLGLRPGGSPDDVDRFTKDAERERTKARLGLK